MVSLTVDASDPAHPGFSLAGNFSASRANPSGFEANQEFALFFQVAPLGAVTILSWDVSIFGVAVNATSSSVSSHNELGSSSGFTGIHLGPAL
jgi:hypothetical protein